MQMTRKLEEKQLNNIKRDPKLAQPFFVPFFSLKKSYSHIEQKIFWWEVSGNTNPVNK